MTEEQCDNNNNKTKCETFNGDTATGRTKWQQWLRDIQLILDDWSWAVMTNSVLDHDMFNTYLEQTHSRRKEARKSSGDSTTGTAADWRERAAMTKTSRAAWVAELDCEAQRGSLLRSEF